jgi:hypothetical protein
MKYVEGTVISIFSLIGIGAAGWALTIAITQLFDSNGWTRLTASDWGTWVGAVGTVGAVIGAIRIATRDRRQRDRVAHDVAVITAAKILLATYAMKVALRAITKALELNQRDGRLFPFVHQGQFLDQLGQFDMDDLLRLAALPNHIGAKLAAANVAIANIQVALRDASTYAIDGMLIPEYFEMVVTHVQFAAGWVDEAHEQCRKVTDVLAISLI